MNELYLKKYGIEIDIPELVKDIIINNVSLLMNNIVLLNEKSQEIQKEIKEKKDLIDNLIRARNSLL